MLRHDTSTQLHRPEKGFTLVELLIAIVISTIVSFAIIAAFTTFTRTQTTQDNVLSMQQNIRAAQYFMAREFRMAGYGGLNPDSNGAGITNANPSFFSFTFLAEDDTTDNDGDGDTDETGELSTIIYQHYDSDGDGINDAVGRTVDGGTQSPVAEHIQELEFLYSIESGNSQSTSTAPASFGDITGVGISILARTARNNTGSASQSFNALSGAVWGPYPDSRLRRLTTSYIRFRNL